MNEYRVARAWRDARVTKIWAGSNEIMKMLIGRDLGFVMARMFVAVVPPAGGGGGPRRVPVRRGARPPPFRLVPPRAVAPDAGLHGRRAGPRPRRARRPAGRRRGARHRPFGTRRRRRRRLPAPRPRPGPGPASRATTTPRSRGRPGGRQRRAGRASTASASGPHLTLARLGARPTSAAGCGCSTPTPARRGRSTSSPWWRRTSARGRAADRGTRWSRRCPCRATAGTAGPAGGPIARPDPGRDARRDATAPPRRRALGVGPGQRGCPAAPRSGGSGQRRLPFVANTPRGAKDGPP